jgi:hypothetical protein
MSFFYDLNKKLDSIRATPEVTHKQLNERDMGKHNNATTGFKAVADKAAKEYGSKAAGERVAGAQFQKMKKSGKLEEEGFPAYAKGIMKYGKDGMDALRDAEAEGEALGPVRKKHNKYDNKEVDEGVMDTVKSVSKKVASGVNRLVGHGSDEEMRKMCNANQVLLSQARNRLPHQNKRQLIQKMNMIILLDAIKCVEVSNNKKNPICLKWTRQMQRQMPEKQWQNKFMILV